LSISIGIAAFSEAECLRLFTPLVEAVLELHARGFAHRDLKPHNILLTSSEPMEPVLTDFGSLAPAKTQILSAHDALELFEDAAQFCSAPYRAPELWESHSSTGLRGEINNGKCDVWSLGCVLYAMAFGPYSPFESGTEGVLRLAIFSGNVRFPPDKSQFGTTFSRAFVDFILWMLTVAPDERPTIYQVLDRVDDLRAGRAVGARGGSRRSLSLRRSLSKKVISQKSGLDDWADFSAFNDLVNDLNDQETKSSASAHSSTVSRSSWQVVSGRPSLADSLASPQSIARVSSLRSHDTDQRRTLSLRGRQLLASALTS
jgi:serine/threonine protein kinase